MIRRFLGYEDAAASDETFVIVFCEECGGATKFPDTLCGNVEECPHCGQYMDVVDSEVSPDEDGIEAREYISPSDMVSRRFRWLLAMLIVAALGVVLTVQIVAWFMGASTGDFGSLMQP